MCDFKPGDEVVCVRDGVRTSGRVWTGTVIAGRAYVVRSLAPVPEHHPDAGQVSVRIIGAPNLCSWTGEDLGYHPSRFRKVEHRRDKLSLTEWLSQPSGDTDGLDKTLPVKKRERVS